MLQLEIETARPPSADGISDGFGAGGLSSDEAQAFLAGELLA
jgi:hypothetical protein